MTEEVQIVPKWLKELEEKRERRLKVRLGHEAGAGSPCLTCEDKCPGLDLHFWRKICKNCKCGKESHDVNDDDIYGWAQFQLLGSKPNKPKKIVLPGRGDEVELEWTPKGQSDVVESYLKDVPINLLPIKGSPAAQERKQLLQKQIPLHDIDPSLCHALSDLEVSKMNDYVAHLKQDSVGMGHIIKLNEILKNRLANSKLLTNRVPLRVPQMENIALHGSTRSLALENATLHGSTHPHALENLNSNRKNLYDIQEDSQVPFNANNINDVNYGVNRSGNFQNVVPRPSAQNPVDYQNLTHTGMIRDINYPVNYVSGGDNSQNYGIPNDIRYLNDEMTKNMENLKLLPNYAQKTLTSQEDLQNPVHSNTLRDIHPDNYNQNDPKGTGYLKTLPNFSQKTLSTDDNVQFPLKLLPNYAQKTLTSQEDLQNPVHSNTLRDIHPDNYNQNDPKGTGYLKTLPNFSQKTLSTDDDVQFPVNSNAIQNIYPDQFNQNNSQNADHYKFFPSAKSEGSSQHYPNSNVYQGSNNPSDDLQFNLNTNSNLPHRAASSHKNYVEEQNPQKISNLKDLAYSTYHPNAPRSPNQHFNPHSHHPSEQNVNPVSVNVGSIKDIEYPNIKSALLNQDVSFAEIPNFSFPLDNLASLFPSCHKCKVTFTSEDDNAIGIERIDALWHPKCFKCYGCNQTLVDFMYCYDKESDNVYCLRDYAKIRGTPRCCACDELIYGEYCLAENSTFHVKHFCCYECDTPLAGQNYLMEDSQPLCLPCYEQVKAAKCSSCRNVIKADDKAVVVKDAHFHVDENCFCCKVCRKFLIDSRLLFKNNFLYCSNVCFNNDQ